MPISITEAKIFACSQSTHLAKKIADAYGAPLGNVITSRYSDGECQPTYEESMRGTGLVVIASTHAGPQQLPEMFFLVDAAKPATASHITAALSDTTPAIP